MCRMALIEKTFELGEGKSITVRRLRNSELRKLAEAVGPVRVAAGKEAAQMFTAELGLRLAITARVGIPGAPEDHPTLGKIMPESVYDEVPRDMIVDVVTHALGESEKEKEDQGN